MLAQSASASASSSSPYYCCRQNMQSIFGTPLSWASDPATLWVQWLDCGLAMATARYAPSRREGSPEACAEEADPLNASAKVEHPFDVVKHLFQHRKTRLTGLAENTARLFTLFGLTDLAIDRHAAGNLCPRCVLNAGFRLDPFDSRSELHLFGYQPHPAMRSSQVPTSPACGGQRSP